MTHVRPHFSTTFSTTFFPQPLSTSFYPLHPSHPLPAGAAAGEAAGEAAEAAAGEAAGEAAAEAATGEAEAADATLDQEAPHEIAADPSSR